METKDKIIEDIKYLFSKINWDESFLDAEAIRIMNTLTRDIQALTVQRDINITELIEN